MQHVRQRIDARQEGVRDGHQQADDDEPDPECDDYTITTTDAPITDVDEPVARRIPELSMHHVVAVCRAGERRLSSIRAVMNALRATRPTPAC